MKSLSICICSAYDMNYSIAQSIHIIYSTHPVEEGEGGKEVERRERENLHIMYITVIIMFYYCLLVLMFYCTPLYN